MEEIVAGDMHSHMIQTNDEFLKHLSSEAAHLINLEFEAVVAGYEVTTAFASLVGTSSSTWLASITRCAFRWEKENDEHDEQKEREEDVVAQAFGPRPEDALLVAKGRLLEQLGRWNDQPNTELVNATVLLNMLQSHSSLLLQDRSTSVCQDFDKHLRALVSVLCELLKQPPMCHAACWALIGKVWPIVLSAQNSKGMQRLVTAAKKCPVKPTIAVWARLAEAAAWQLELPVLEELKDLVSEEASMAQAGKYVEYQFFSLLLVKSESSCAKSWRDKRLKKFLTCFGKLRRTAFLAILAW